MPQLNGTTEPTPPIQFPVIAVAGRFFTLRFELYAQYLLDKSNVNVVELMTLLIPRLPDGKVDPNPPMKPGRVVAMMTLLSACAAHNFTENRETAWTADEWAQKIPLNLWSECCTAVGQALIKAPQAAAPSPAPPAVETSGPLQ